MKKIIFLIMVFLLFGSWFFAIAGGLGKEEAYNTYINNANQYLSKEIYIDAIDCYKKAIEIHPDILENKLFLAKIYKQAKMYNSFESYCIELSNEYKDNEEIISLLCEYYTKSGKEEKAIVLCKSYLSLHKDSKIVAQILEDLKSSFEIEYKTYSYISTFRNGYAIFKKIDKYGIMDASGNEVVNALYDFAGIYTKPNSINIAAVSKDKEYYYIDLNGDKRRATDISYDYLSSFSTNGKGDKETYGTEKAVYKKENYYGYLDENFKENKEKFDYASSFYENKVAAVKKDNKWFLIDKNIEKINDKYYDDIKIDDLDCAVRSNIIFAKKDGKYMMIDTTGREITKPLFDDIDFFININEYAAVKIGNKWGFANLEGKLVIEAKYDGAFSFSHGLAPVLVEGKWGYIDINEKLVINPQFNMAKPFNNKGIAPILKSEWQLLKLKMP
jgi:tetratricopeptide (TPR) repeat protein